MIEEDKLVLALRHTYNPDRSKRKEAEQFLAQVAPQAGFLVSLLKVIVADGLEDSVRLGAAVQLKNGIWYNWARNEQENENDAKYGDASTRYFGNMPKFIVSEDDKRMIRENIPEALARSESRPLRKLLANCCKKLAKEDYPEAWPGILSKAMNLILTQDPSKMHAGLMILKKLVGKYKYKTESHERQPLYDIVNATFPTLRQLLQAVINGNSADLLIGELARITLRIFLSGTLYGMPPLIKQKEELFEWTKLTASVLLKEMPSVPTKQEARDHPWWEAKKSAAQIMERFFSRYSVPLKTKQEDVDLCPLISGHGGITETIILPAVMQVLHDHFEHGKFCTEVVISHLLVTIENAAYFSSFFKMMKPELPFLYHKVLLRCLSWSEEELQEWENDPQQLVSDVYSFSRSGLAHGLDVASDAKSCLEALCRFRTRFTMPVCMELISQVVGRFQQNPSNLACAIDMTGALRIFETIAHVIRRDKGKYPVPNIVNELILPQMQSPFAFLRWSACNALRRYMTIRWANQEAEVRAAQSMLQLLVDPSFPVRVEACLCLSIIFDHGTPAMHQVVRQNIAQIVENYVIVMRETSVDDVFGSLQALIKTYKNEIRPLGVQICSSLAQTFVRLATEEPDDNDKEFSSIEVAANESLLSLDEVITALSLDEEGQPKEYKRGTEEEAIGNELVTAVTPLIMPMIEFVLVGACCEYCDPSKPFDMLCENIGKEIVGPNGLPKIHVDLLDMFEYTFHILKVVTYHVRPTPKPLWRLFPLLARVVLKFGSDYAANVYAIIENMIQYDPASFVAPNILNVNNMDLLMEMVKESLTLCIKESIEDAEKKKKRGGDDDDDDDEDYDDDDDDDEDFGDDMFDDGDGMYVRRNADDDAEYALFCLCTAFQSCTPPQLDTFVAPVLSMMVEACKTPFRTPNLMVDCLTLIQSVIFYDPIKALSAIGEQNLEKYFKDCFEYLDSHSVIAEKMIAILSFIKILAIPPSQAGVVINNYRPHIIQAIASLVASLNELRKAIEQGRKDEEARLAQEMAEREANQSSQQQNGEEKEYIEVTIYEKFREGHPDVPEECNVFDYDPPGQQGTADTSFGSLSEGERFHMMASFLDDDDDEFDEDYEDDDGQEGVESPVDHIDESLFFYQTMSTSSKETQNGLEQALQQTPPHVQQLIQALMVQGSQRAPPT